MADEQKNPEQQGHPGRALKRVVIKEEFVALTGNHVKAVILAQFEYWQHRVREIDRYVTEERTRAASSGEHVEIQPTEGWIYKDAKELSEETMLGLARNSMLRHIKSLVEAGYLLQRSNPHHKWDKTLQYRLNLHKISEDLTKLGYSLEGWILPANNENPEMEARSSKMESRESKMESQASNLDSRKYESGTAIPETTSEITIERDIPSVDHSDAPARKSSTAKSGTKPIDGLIDRPTNQQEAEKTSSATTTTSTLEETSPSENSASSSSLPEEDGDHSAPDPVEALRRNAEAISTSEVCPDAQEVTSEVLEGLPHLQHPDRCRVAKLAEHYHRREKINVLRDAAYRVAQEAKQGRVKSVVPYLTASCANAEEDYSEGDANLLAGLSGEGSSKPVPEDETPPIDAGGKGQSRQYEPNPDLRASRLWERVLDDAAEEMGSFSMRVWFEGSVAVYLSDETLMVSVPNGVAKEYIEARFGESLQEQLVKHLSPTATLELVLDPEGATDNTNKWDATGKEGS